MNNKQRLEFILKQERKLKRKRILFFLLIAIFTGALIVSLQTISFQSTPLK